MWQVYRSIQTCNQSIIQSVNQSSVVVRLSTNQTGIQVGNQSVSRRVAVVVVAVRISVVAAIAAAAAAAAIFL